MNAINQLLFRSNRLRISFTLGVCYYLVLWLLWLVFKVFFIELNQELDFNTWQTVLYLQHKFNLSLAAIVITPLLIFGLIPQRILTPKNFYKLSQYFYFLLITFTLLFYIFNWGYYVYLAKLIDVSVFRFFENSSISASFLWESYPVITITILWFISSFLLYWISFYWVRKVMIKNPNPMFRTKFISKFVAFFIVLLLVGLAIFGRLSQYPLRWSEAFFSPNSKVSYLTINPIIYFVNTLKNKDTSYDLKKTKQSYKIVADFLGVPKALQNNEKLTFYRKQPAKNKNAEQYNVVFIMLETIGANRLGIYGNPLNITPNLDAIAKKGYWFKNFFVPENGTARGIYTSLFGIADVSPVKTATRNPLIVHQTSLINDFKNYKKHYLLGGSASWANIRAMLTFNIKNLNLYEGTYHNDGPKIDVWGISDTVLFRKANRLFENETKNNHKFIAYIQTATNHRPFTIPKDNENFKKKIVSDELLKKNGFFSLAQFNGTSFLDHNIGYFFSLFRKSNYYGKTIFVIFTDENDRTYPVPFMRPLESKTELDALHVPLIIYAPGIIDKPKVFEQAASLVDIFPTVSYLANVEVANTTMGKNLLKTDKNHVAFVLRGNLLKPTIGLIQNEYYFRSQVNGKNAELLDLRSKELTPVKINETNQKLFDYFSKLSMGIYQTSRYLQYNNGK